MKFVSWLGIIGGVMGGVMLGAVQWRLLPPSLGGIKTLYLVLGLLTVWGVIVLYQVIQDELNRPPGREVQCPQCYWVGSIGHWETQGRCPACSYAGEPSYHLIRPGDRKQQLQHSRLSRHW